MEPQQARRPHGQLSAPFYNAMDNQRFLSWNPRTRCFLSSAEFYHARKFIFEKCFMVWSQ